VFALNNKVAIVTGGNKGIGLGMACGLAEAGASVAVAGRNQAMNENAAETLRQLGAEAMPIALDVTDSHAITEAVEAIVSRWGRLDILVNNAGTTVRDRPEDLAEEDWHTVIDTNVTSAFLCSKACYPHFRSAGGGKILNCGSMYSLFGSEWVPAYGASKGAIVQLTKSTAVAWARDNIQVNCFLPGWIDTDLTRMVRDQSPEIHQRVIDRTPAGRWGDPRDLEGIAVFLASPASDFITGAVIPVDGGYSAFG
jgi:2-deoxy-D-gluconate 3-dehydrogenase